ncbi:MAG: alpha/beta fold hydrolase [Brachybacterium sp.]
MSSEAAASASVPGAGLLGEDVIVRTADGRQLRTMQRGAGPDLVVLEAGLGASGLFWGPVHELLAEHVRVIAYDRAGYGGSDPDTAPRDLARLAADLDAVLWASPHQRLVLAGHSWGGPVVRTVAARRLLAGRSFDGLVLVDPSDEHAALYFSRVFRAQAAIQSALLEPFARTGLLGWALGAMHSDLEEPFRRATVAASSTRSAARAARAENAHVVAGLQHLRDAPFDLGDLPVRIISGRRAGRLERASRDALSRAHRMTAQGLKAGRYLEAHRSGHMVPLSEPELVAREILSLLH